VIERMGVPLANGGGEDKPIFTTNQVCFNGLSKCGHPNRPLGITWPSKDARGVGADRPVGGPGFGRPSKLARDLNKSFGKAVMAIGEDTHIPVEDEEVVDGLIADAVHANDKPADVTKEGWFAGEQLTTRTCGGDCSHETFAIDRIYKPPYKGAHPVEKISHMYRNPDGTEKPVYANPLTVGKWFECCKTAFKPYDLAVTACLVIAKHHFGDLMHIASDGEMEHWKDGMEIVQRVLNYGNNFKLPEDQ
jgi:hypothetical protein